MLYTFFPHLLSSASAAFSRSLAFNDAVIEFDLGEAMHERGRRGKTRTMFNERGYCILNTFIIGIVAEHRA